MTKKLTPWKKQYRQILRDITAGRIIVDHNFYLADFDGLIFLVRGDLLPVSYTSAWMEMRVIIKDYRKDRVPWKVLIKGAPEEELKRLKDDEEAGEAL